MSNPSRNNLLDKVRSFRLSKADFRQLTNSGLTHKGRQTLARMFPRNFSDLTSRPILGPVGHIRIGYLAASAVLGVGGCVSLYESYILDKAIFNASALR